MFNDIKHLWTILLLYFCINIKLYWIDSGSITNGSPRRNYGSWWRNYPCIAGV